MTRPLTYLGIAAWVVTMTILVHRSYLQASTANLATDLARYGPTATWSGVYYRGEKIGFTVSQTTRTDEGFELQQDGQLQMLLLGQDTAAAVRTTARVDQSFVLRSFEFSLDPGTGPTVVTGVITPRGSGAPADTPTKGNPPPTLYQLTFTVTAGGSTRTEMRELHEPPVIPLNLPRVLASGRLVTGSTHSWMVLDPATLHAARMTVHVGERAIVRTGEAAVPAFKLEMEFQGLRTTSWVTDTGDVVREESPLGLMTIRETAERAQRLAVPDRIQSDLLRASAIVPRMRQRIDDPRNVRRLRVRLAGGEIPRVDMNGAGQFIEDDVIEIRDVRSLRGTALDLDLDRYLGPETFIESEAPEIVAETQQALRAVPPDGTDRARAEQLVRYVNVLLEKKPTVSLPSAKEVLRTKVGDCNEHTALYVAMARAAGLPARIAVGVVYMHGAFYYHAWPEVYVRDAPDRGLWLPVDPTLNQFPADATHLRLARGSLDKQSAIVPLLGRLQMDVLDVEFVPGSTPVLVGRELQADDLDLAVPLVAPPREASGGCRCPDSR